MKLKARVGISLLALLTLIGCRQTNESSSFNSSITKPSTGSGSSITTSSYDALLTGSRVRTILKMQNSLMLKDHKE